MNTDKPGNNKKTILIVDDKPENISIIVGLLPKYNKIVVLNGKNALKKAHGEKKPDLILLDIMMPEMDGYEVCKQLKASPQTKNIPIIFLTASVQEDAETKGFQLGAVDYITKPIKPTVLQARIRTHLELQQTKETLEKKNEALLEAAQLREDVERITRHDLKLPLSSILAIPDLLMMDDNITASQTESLKVLRDSGYQMLHMINLSLDLFKMERGIYQVHLENVDLILSVKKILKEFNGLIVTKDLSVALLLNSTPVVPDSCFVVQGETLLYYSMLANLIKNAIEASPEKKIITFNFNNNKFRKLSIHNEGAVPVEIRTSFFDKYSTYGKVDGSGLGSYSAKLIAKTLQGDIILDTSVEDNTTLILQIPHHD
ncbi:MAG: hybrid sensor histidine kinase/response regulator [gamma proteobacterium symbiont of Taylorina sp.]|nr:hybrid sensor histidine kinase/response regulator [gamma proteobacterium symbiont of Taylorina sp.]